MEKVIVGLPFSSITDLFYFLGVMVVAGILVIWTVHKIAMTIKGE